MNEIFVIHDPSEVSSVVKSAGFLSSLSDMMGPRSVSEGSRFVTCFFLFLTYLVGGTFLGLALRESPLVLGAYQWFEMARQGRTDGRACCRDSFVVKSTTWKVIGV